MAHARDLSNFEYFNFYFGITRRYVQKKMGVNFIFYEKKLFFSSRFSYFYGQRSVTAAWATSSPWIITLLLLESAETLGISLMKKNAKQIICKQRKIFASSQIGH